MYYTNEAFDLINTEILVDENWTAGPVEEITDFAFDNAIGEQIRANAAAIDNMLAELFISPTLVPAAPPPVAILPYKRKYETAGELLQHLATTSSRKEVASLWYVNSTLIENTPGLTKAFTDRKAVFFPPYKMAAA